MHLIKKYYLFIVILFTFVGYFPTLAPSLVELDSGELATAQAISGTPHPTGYPLFTLLGYVFLKLPLALSPIYKSNLLSLMWNLCSVVFFAMIFKLVFSNVKYFGKKGEQETFINETRVILLAVLGSLIYAFSKTVWTQATFVEVYSLHLLLLNMVIYFFFKSIIHTGENEFKIHKYWIIFALILGLGFSNHLSIIYLVPGIMLMFFLRYGFRFDYIKHLGILFFIFIIPIVSLYSYLVIRAANNPLLNWGNPSNLDRLWYHLTGSQFKALAFSETHSPLNVLLNFFYTLSFNTTDSYFAVGEFGVFIVVSILGIYFLLRSFPSLALTFIAFFLTTLLFSINYQIVDIQAYFLLSYFSIAFFAAAGLILIIEVIEGKLILKFTTVLVIIFIVLQYAFTYREVDRRDVFIFEDFNEVVFNSLEPNALIFCSGEDPFVATSYYSQFVLNKRRDIIKIIAPFLIGENWYPESLNQFSPGIIKNTNQGSQLDVSGRPIYVSLGVYQNDAMMKSLGFQKSYFIPENLCFRFQPGIGYIPIKYTDLKLRFTGKQNAYTKDIEEYLTIMMRERINYELKFGREDKAKELLDKIRKLELKNAYTNYY